MRKRALLVVVTSLAVTVQASGESRTYRDTDLRYSLALPEGWEQIPNDVVEATVTQTAQLANMPVQKYAAGFQRTSGTWFSYPYVLIHHQSVNSATFSQLSRLMRDLGSGEKDLVPGDQDVISEAGIGAPVTDPGRGIVMVPFNMNVADVGPVRGLMVLKPGKLGIAQLNFYAPEEKFEAYGADLDVFLESLRFDEGYEYSGVGAVARGLDLDRILEKGLVGALTFARWATPT